MTRGNVLAYTKPRKTGTFSNIKKEPGLQQQIEKYQGSKIIGMFCVLMHIYIRYKDV